MCLQSLSEWWPSKIAQFDVDGQGGTSVDAFDAFVHLFTYVFIQPAFVEHLCHMSLCSGLRWPRHGSYPQWSYLDNVIKVMNKITLQSFAYSECSTNRSMLNLKVLLALGEKIKSFAWC